MFLQAAVLPLAGIERRVPRCPCASSSPYPNSQQLSAASRVSAASRSLAAFRSTRLNACSATSCNLPLNLPLTTPLLGFDSISSALEDIAAGKALVVVDDEDRENEGDLIIAADKVSEADMAFMIEHTSGVVCIAMEAQDLERLRLPLMVNSAENEEAMSTAFTITVDLKEGTSTGISAGDRAKTIRAMAKPTADPKDFRRPGHIFPLRYRHPGVLVRPGHTEASVDLARLAGCYPAGVLCELVNKDGSMQRTPQLLEFAKQYGLKCITIADLIRYRLRHEQLIQQSTVAQVQTHFGVFTAHCFVSKLDGAEHVAMVYGNVSGRDNVETVVQSESSLLDAVSALSSGLSESLQAVAAAGQGVVIYLRSQLQRGINVSSELANLTPTHGSPAVKAYSLDMRDYAVAAQILRALSVSSVKLVAAEDSQALGLQNCGLKVSAHVPRKQPAASNGVHKL